ncbi:MAG: decaprenyl-phosphate phosphoribosyltransferase [Hylemonella sp.]
MKTLHQLLVLIRPHQWLKNVFVFAGLFFSGHWHDELLVQSVLRAFLAFCCFSSLVYILNDWQDRVSDAQHPIKRLRPIASGALGMPIALITAALLMTIGLGLASGNPVLLTILILYLILNLAYSWRLKQVPVVDVSIIASGFILRILAGTSAVGIPPSRWLLLTGLFLALFLGFSKRKAEPFHAPEQQRAILGHYTGALLDIYMAVTLTATLLTYSLYATSDQVLAQQGERLVYTLPVVIFCLLRYAYQVHQGRGEDVSRDLIRDPWIMAGGAVWLMIFFMRRF